MILPWSMVMQQRTERQISPTETAPLEEDALRMLTSLPVDALVRVLRSVHEDLLKQALAPNDSSKRSRTRQRTLRSGKIIYNNQTCVMDCQIRDMSEGGCRVRVANTANLPRHFDIQITGRRERQLCEVKWRSPQELGVQFIG